MRAADVPAYLRDTLLRGLPHRGPTGLIPIGSPGRGSPVLLTGNFTLTVRRLRDALRGRDVWLLSADSKGINVWCAAGGGHLTHHDVISVIRTSGIADRVDHHEIVLPQLCATGVEPRKITESTGWTTRWGPARLEDLPGFLDRGRSVLAGERTMRFPLWERMEMALLWCAPILFVSIPVLWWFWGAATMASAALAITATCFGLFGFLKWLHLSGRGRWITFLALAILCAAMGLGLLHLLGAASHTHLYVVAILSFVVVGILSVDLEGSTPWFGSTINTFHNAAHIELVEDQCTGAADCVQVCPRDVLHMNGRRRKVEIVRPDQCIQCGACIVQCPVDALRFRNDDGRVIEAGTIRRTRMNMLGRRTVEVGRP